MIVLRGENNKIVLQKVKISDFLPHIPVKISDNFPSNQT